MQPRSPVQGQNDARLTTGVEASCHTLLDIARHTPDQVTATGTGAETPRVILWGAPHPSLRTLSTRVSNSREVVLNENHSETL